MMNVAVEQDAHAAAGTENLRSTMSKKKCIRFGKLFSGIFSQDDTELRDINYQTLRYAETRIIHIHILYIYIVINQIHSRDSLRIRICTVHASICNSYMT